MTDKARLVMVEWVDSREPSPEWRRLEEFKPDGFCECVSVGFAVFEGPRQIVLAPNMADIQTDDMQASGIIYIPMCSVTRVVDLEEKDEVESCDSD